MYEYINMPEVMSGLSGSNSLNRSIGFTLEHLAPFCSVSCVTSSDAVVVVKRILVADYLTVQDNWHYHYNSVGKAIGPLFLSMRFCICLTLECEDTSVLLIRLMNLVPLSTQIEVKAAKVHCLLDLTNLVLYIHPGRIVVFLPSKALIAVEDFPCINPCLGVNDYPVDWD